MHLTTPNEEVPLVGLCVQLLLFLEHHDSPDGPVVVVENHTELGLMDGTATLANFHRPLSAGALVSLMKLVVLSTQSLNLAYSREVLEVVLDAAALWMGVVTDHLVKVVA